MKDIMRSWKVLILAGLLLAGTGHATSLDWRTISFNAGHPVSGESLEESLDNTSHAQLENLAVNVSILKQYPTVPYDVVGRASKDECDPVSCMALSARRAQLVYDYLMRHGVPACQIKSIIATGSGSPIATRDEGSAPDQTVDLMVTKGDSCQ